MFGEGLERDDQVGSIRGDGGDRKNIARLLALLPERSRREERPRAFARRLVRRHQIAIALVAAALAEKLELTGAEMDAWVVRPVYAFDKLLAEEPACHAVALFPTSDYSKSLARIRDAVAALPVDMSVTL